MFESRFVDTTNKVPVPYLFNGNHMLFGGPIDLNIIPDWVPDIISDALSPNPIYHFSDSINRVSFNVAYEDHIFSGYVKHSVTVTSAGRVRVTTFGIGSAINKLHASFNNNVGIMGFSGTHAYLRSNYK